jgi:NDP-sugar pyrophosphorylase family protein
MSVQAVILAGGMGTRLRPLTLHRPKPVVPLVNVPFLHHQLALLGAHGVTDVILSVSHMPDVIRATMGDGKPACACATSSRRSRSGRRGRRNAADLVEGGWWC